MCTHQMAPLTVKSGNLRSTQKTFRLEVAEDALDKADECARETEEEVLKKIKYTPKNNVHTDINGDKYSRKALLWRMWWNILRD